MVKQILTQFEMAYRKGPTISADVDLDMESDKVWVLFGHSGSGKTTFLRVLAGLERPRSGLLTVDQDLWLDTNRKVFVPPGRRHVGFLHQDYALFPHMSVDENILYGLKARRVPDASSRLSEVKELLRIEALGERRPAQISGGQRQRVALARALATRPRLLLLDEPLSALDAPTRTKVRRELRQWLQNLDIATILVTHDRGEAMTLGARALLQDQGRILQVGPVDQLFRRPNSLAAARCVGVENLLPCQLVESTGETTTINISGIRLQAASRPSPDTSQRDQVIVAIRAEDIQLSSDSARDTSANFVTGAVGSVHPEGALTRITLKAPIPLEFFVSHRRRITPGETLTVEIPPDALHLIFRTGPEHSPCQIQSQGEK